MSRLCELSEDVVLAMLLEAVAKAGGARAWMVVGIAGQGCGIPECGECLWVSPVAHAMPRQLAKAAAESGEALQLPPPDACPTCGALRHRAHAVGLARTAANVPTEVAAVARRFILRMANALGE